MSTKKTPNLIPKKVLEHYERLVASVPGLPRKDNTMPYTSVNGHMFSFLDKTGAFSLRLPREEREAFIEKYKAPLSVQHGRVMKEYVVVPHEMLEKLEKIKPYFTSSYAYTKSLKPKVTKKNN